MGSFALQSASVKLSPSDGPMPNSEINFEGHVNCELAGDVYATMNFKSAESYTLTSLAILNDGAVIGASGRGTTSFSAAQKWNFAGASNINDTSSMAVKGVIDLEKSSFAGELIERE
ncbi:MAG: hypothetical protein ACU84Q_14135 [Gammaproteobacteria bacterium]